MLLSSRGVKIRPPHGDFVFGSETYVDAMLPVLEQALESKGFLPFRHASPWAGEWDHALYQLSLDVREQLEGSYLSSANRLTRIEARLTLSSRAADGWRWQTAPTARSTVPLPNLPAYLSSRVALSRDRSDEMERLLYDNAGGRFTTNFGTRSITCQSAPRGKYSRPTELSFARIARTQTRLHVRAACLVNCEGFGLL